MTRRISCTVWHICATVPHMSQTEHLSASEAADVIGQSKATVKRLAKAGTIPIAFKVGGDRGAYVFHRADVEAYAASRRAELVAAVAKLDEAS